MALGTMTGKPTLFKPGMLGAYFEANITKLGEERSRVVENGFPPGGQTLSSVGSAGEKTGFQELEFV
jgi:hypothetical protein